MTPLELLLRYRWSAAWILYIAFLAVLVERVQ